MVAMLINQKKLESKNENVFLMMGDEIELEVYDGLLHHILETGASYADLKEQ